MRNILALGLSLVAAGGCFEETNPVDETGAMQSSTGEECIAGTEGCPCIEGECVSGLECFSNICVDAGATSMTTDEPETTSATSTTGPSTTTVGTTPMTSTDEGPLDEGPMTSDAGGDLPAGSQCDPFFDMCAMGLDCNGVGMEQLVCSTPGLGEQNVPCDKIVCAAEFLCTYGLATCMSESCCAALCDLTLDGECAAGLDCTPFYPMGAPLGYEHVGVCVG